MGKKGAIRSHSIYSIIFKSRKNIHHNGIGLCSRSRISHSSQQPAQGRDTGNLHRSIDSLDNPSSPLNLSPGFHLAPTDGNAAAAKHT